MPNVYSKYAIIKDSNKFINCNNKKDDNKNNKLITENFNLGNAIASPFKNIGNSIKDFFTNTFTNFFKNIGNSIKNFFTGAFVNFFKSIGDFFMNIFKSIFDFFASIFGAIGQWIMYSSIIALCCCLLPILAPIFSGSGKGGDDGDDD